jgi:hypothetical protein
MITLTTVPQVQSVLGGNTPVGYDKLVVGTVTHDIIGKVITAQLRLTSTSNSQMEPLPGTLVIRHGTSEALLTIDHPAFRRRLLLSSPQVTAVQTNLDDTQADLENAMISLGIVAGTRSAGT